MKNSTHYLFGVGLLNLFALVLIKDPELAWLFLGLSFPLGSFSLVPNLLDKYTAANWQYGRIQLKPRVRHPLTHSPWTLGYFFPCYYLIDSFFSDPALLLTIFTLSLAWFSHLFLDSLNPEGIPLGKQPIYLPHPVKHYSWQKRSKTRNLRLARIPFNDLERNTTFSRFGVFFIALNLADLLLNHFYVISEVITLYG
ncbi:MAG: metal-dependent hydrolase [Candidatus Hodarchaeota archaeon]